MTHQTILTALAQELTSKGYEANYLGPDSTIQDLYKLAIYLFHAPEEHIYLYCWNTHPHIILMAGPDWKADLSNPNSIEELYKELNKRLT